LFDLTFSHSPVSFSPLSFFVLLWASRFSADAAVAVAVYSPRLSVSPILPFFLALPHFPHLLDAWAAAELCNKRNWLSLTGARAWGPGTEKNVRTPFF